MPADPQRVRDLFLAAAELSPDHRAILLAERCGTDAEFLAEVNRLLTAHEHLASILDLPAAPNGTAAYTPVKEGPGSIIGPYKLLQKIGEGGFGVVYMAEQEKPVRRQVALKIIKPGMDSAAVIARFESERQALALMEHPNIAHVLDAGATETGRPYFVMELVKGVPITEFCDKNHMPPGQRLQLFIDVCHAVQHAHHKGIIHRDLKPSNVMVTLHDGVPVVKVIDFGVAKATQQKLTERTLFTAYGQMVGTPAYMSPEQAEMSGLDIDTRSDIYSLGVLLYELLTGTTPLEAKRLREAGYAEMQRLIREEEPPRPSTRLSSLGDSATIFAGNRGTDVRQLARLLAGDLDWIVMRALEKDRNRRYCSPGEFAADLDRYIRHDAVLARPPSSVYRFRKFIRRNRAVVITLAAVATALFTGAAVAAWQAVEATQAKRDALAAADAERRAKQDAEQREAESRAVLAFVEKQIFAAARPTGQAGGLGRQVTLRQALDAALPFVVGSFQNQPLIEARLRLTLAISYGYLGEPRRGVEQCEAARALFITHFGPDHPSTLNCLNQLAQLYGEAGRHEEALRLQQSVVERTRARYGSDHRETLGFENNLACAYKSLGREAEALKLLEATRTRMETLLRADDPFLMNALENVSESYAFFGRHDDALRLREKTQALRNAQSGPDHPDTLRGATSVARLYLATHRYDEAQRLLEETLPLMKAKLGEGHAHTLISTTFLANVYSNLGRHDAALPLNERALALRRQTYDAHHPDVLAAATNLAYSYLSLDRHAEALKLFEETLAVQKAHLPAHHPVTHFLTVNLAACLTKLGRHAEAIQLHQQSLAVMREKHGPDHPYTLQSLTNLAATHADCAQNAESAKYCQEVLKLHEKKHGPDHPDTLLARYHLAIASANLGRHEEALELDRQTLKLMRDKFGPDHPHTLWCLNNIAAWTTALGRHEEAHALSLQVLEARRAKLGFDHADTLNAARNVAASLLCLGRQAEACKLHQDTLILARTKHGPSHSLTLQCQYAVADTFSIAGRNAEALAFYEEALTLTQTHFGASHPETLYAANELAWFLATTADLPRRDPARAVKLATSTTAAAQAHAGYRGTLGAARYRAGDWKGAAADLEKAVAMRRPDAPDNAINAYFLAMAHHRLGQSAPAAEWLAKAQRWQKLAHKQNDHHFNRYRAEAQAVLNESPPKP